MWDWPARYIAMQRADIASYLHALADLICCLRKVNFYAKFSVMIWSGSLIADKPKTESWADSQNLISYALDSVVTVLNSTWPLRSTVLTESWADSQKLISDSVVTVLNSSWPLWSTDPNCLSCTTPSLDSRPLLIGLESRLHRACSRWLLLLHQDRSQRNERSAATTQSLWFLAHCFYSTTICYSLSSVTGHF